MEVVDGAGAANRRFAVAAADWESVGGARMSESGVMPTSGPNAPRRRCQPGTRRINWGRRGSTKLIPNVTHTLVRVTRRENQRRWRSKSSRKKNEARRRRTRQGLSNSFPLSSVYAVPLSVARLITCDLAPTKATVSPCCYRSWCHH